jgi:RND family efflux transporter MFP subunit
MKIISKLDMANRRYIFQQSNKWAILARPQIRKLTLSYLKQIAFIFLLLFAALASWVYFSPSAIKTLAMYNLAITPLTQISALNPIHQENPTVSELKSVPREQRQVQVITSPVTLGVVNDRLNAIGNGRAAQSVTITSQVSGQIVKLSAGSGDRIEAGALIASLDAESETLALEKATLAAADLRSKAERARALFESKSTTATAVESANVELSAAELTVREAQLNLDRRFIRSPIGGIMGIVTANVGDYVTNQLPIVTIDDRSKIIIEFYVPERFATAIKVGAPVTVVSVARPGEENTGAVVAIDNRIDVASRTLQVRAQIENSNDELRAGMAFQVMMRFEGEKFAAVDPLAIQWDSRGSYVWLIDINGKAQRKYSRIVQRNPELVLVDADLVEGDVVVTEGVQNLRVGSTVKVLGSDIKQPDTAESKAVGS